MVIFFMFFTLDLDSVHCVNVQLTVLCVNFTRATCTIRGDTLINNSLIRFIICRRILG